MFLIAASKKDVAGMNIAKQIIDNYGFEKTSENFQQNPSYFKNLQDKQIKLVFLNEETIFAQHITDNFSPQLLVFVSRHSGVAGIPTLSVHTPGNLTEKAEFGGLPRKISVSPASAMKNTLLEMMRLKEEMGLNYEVNSHFGIFFESEGRYCKLKNWEGDGSYRSKSRSGGKNQD